MLSFSLPAGDLDEIIGKRKPIPSSCTAREYRMSYNLRALITGLVLSILALVWGILYTTIPAGEELAPIIVHVRNGITIVLGREPTGIVATMVFVWVSTTCTRSRPEK